MFGAATRRQHYSLRFSKRELFLVDGPFQVFIGVSKAERFFLIFSKLCKSQAKRRVYITLHTESVCSLFLHHSLVCLIALLLHCDFIKIFPSVQRDYLHSESYIHTAVNFHITCAKKEEIQKSVADQTNPKVLKTFRKKPD